MRYAAELDAVLRIRRPPAIMRAFWSKRCAWPGDSLWLHVETRNVPDDTPITLTLLEDDSDEGNPDDVLGTLAGSRTIRGGKWSGEYVLDLAEQALGAPLEVEGDSYEFVFEVAIERYGLLRRSTRLYVPIEPFEPSR